MSDNFYFKIYYIYKLNYGICIYILSMNFFPQNDCIQKYVVNNQIMCTSNKSLLL